MYLRFLTASRGRNALLFQGLITYQEFFRLVFDVTAS